VALASHVLHLRGPHPCPQPFPLLPLAEDHVQRSSWLVYNGEIYSGLSGLAKHESDTAMLADALAAAVLREGRDAEHAILAVVSALRGPWALIFWDARAQKLWFGRDPTGRRSLCFSQTARALLLCSVAGDEAGEEWHELPATGMFCASACCPGEQSGIVAMTGDASRAEQKVAVGETTHGEGSKVAAGDDSTDVVRVELHPWADRAAAAGGDSGGATDLVYTERVPAPRPMVPAWPMQPTISMDAAVGEFCQALQQAVTARVATFDNVEAATEEEALPAVGVLFSGGVDCMVLAALASRVIPDAMPIDLINVAFENRRRQGYSEARAFDVPDRRTAIAGAAELQRVAPGRDWRLVGVNVTAGELDARREHIRRLIRPLRTELDDSIGCALWFAASGRGYLLDAGGEPLRPYTSTAPVLLLGMGADEQLGGYGRHRSAFERGMVGEGSGTGSDVCIYGWQCSLARSCFLAALGTRLISSPFQPVIQEDKRVWSRRWLWTWHASRRAT
jgi:asparagine synthetase B (glutamine-hydrolysing)